MTFATAMVDSKDDVDLVVLHRWDRLKFQWLIRYGVAVGSIGKGVACVCVCVGRSSRSSWICVSVVDVHFWRLGALGGSSDSSSRSSEKSRGSWLSTDAECWRRSRRIKVGGAKSGLNTIGVVFITSLQIVSKLVFIKPEPYTPWGSKAWYSEGCCMRTSAITSFTRAQRRLGGFKTHADRAACFASNQWRGVSTR